MSLDSPLTCYICGEVNWTGTMDLIGCLKDQEGSFTRFIEKHNDYPRGYLYICGNCYWKKHPYAKRIIAEYGMYGMD